MNKPYVFAKLNSRNKNTTRLDMFGDIGMYRLINKGDKVYTEKY